MRKADPKLELGTYEIAADQACGLDVDSLKLELLALFRSADYRPPLLPVVLPPGRARVPFSRAWHCVQEIHESCSELLAKIWRLPPDIALVLSLHHRLALDGHVHPSAAVVAVADGLAQEFGFGFHDETNPLRTESAARLLGLDELGLSRLRNAAEDLAKARTEAG